MGGWGWEWKYYVLAMLPLMWPSVLANPSDFGALWFLAALAVVAAEAALVWWLAGGSRVRAALLAFAILLLPPLLFVRAARKVGDIPMYIKDEHGHFVKVDGVSEDDVVVYTKDDRGNMVRL